MTTTNAEYTEQELAEIRRLDEIAFYENEANEYPRDDFSPRKPLAAIDPDTAGQILHAEEIEETRQAEQSRAALVEAIAAKLGRLDAATLVKIAKLIG